MSPIRVRFAPSPTGLLHVGGARTAIFNYFFAKRFGGQFILRIEDTDTERSKKEWEEEILFSMKWLGLNWDEGPFYQTKRFDVYRDYARQLVEKNQAYRCYCTSAELDEMRKVAEREGRKPMYDRRCRELKQAPAGKPHVIRFKTPLTGEVVVHDLIHKDVHFNNVECDDFIILRSNDTPTYNFTVVVDDIDMKITHVIRGDDHLSNTPKQILIMRALGWQPPQYAHVPMILAPDKTKLSKRHGAVAVSQFREEGYLPEAMVNALVRLGWSHGDQEFFTADDLSRLFNLESCGVSGSVFDRSKLDSINAHYLRLKAPEELVRLLKENHGVDLSALLTKPSGLKLIKAVTERAIKLTDLIAATRWLTQGVGEKEPAALEALDTVKPGALDALRASLNAIPDAEFTSDKIAAAFKEAAAKIGGKMPDVAKPARALLTGSLQSPDIGIVVEALGKSVALQRLSAS